MLKCIKQIKELAASVGATLDEDNAEFGLTVDAPAGYVWRATGGPALHEPATFAGSSWWSKACQELARRMAQGLDKCSPAEAAAIEYDRDEDWTPPADGPDFIPVGHLAMA